MNITFSVDEQIAARAREKADAMGKSLNQAVREYLQHLAGEFEAERENEEFVKRCGQGNSQGWRFNRDEIYERR
jgi:antitoxin component of RelBE/YafQ-DinJ toxin-antitoxin module